MGAQSKGHSANANSGQGDTMSTGLIDAYSGNNVFYVADSNRGSGGGSDTNPGTRTRPFATLDYAVGRCTADQGDVIMVMPGYAQDVDGASGITFDVAGIRVVGMGENDLRPKLTYQASASTIVISAADVVLENFVHIASFADVTNPIVTSAKGTVLRNHLFRDEAADLNFANCIRASGSTDRDNDFLHIESCYYTTVDTLSFNFIQIAADVHDMVVKDCVFETFATATVEFMNIEATASIFGAEVSGVYTRNRDIAATIGMVVSTTTDNTGLFRDCHMRTLDTAGELMTATGTGVYFQRTRGHGAVSDDKQGYTLPTADAV